MLQHLPETGAARERRMGQTLASVLMHAAIITAVAAATAGGHEVSTHTIVADTTLIYRPDIQPAGPSTTTSRGATSSTVASDPSPTHPLPNFDASSIPDPGIPTVWPRGDSVGTEDIVAAPSGALTSGTAATIGEAQTDEPVRVLVESVPRYPAALRAMGVPGTVEMEFVVDTAGRADPASLRVISSTGAPFTVAVRTALREARFVAGRYHGRAVRTLVRRAYRFEVEGRP